MRFSRFFIDRPIFAAVLSIVIFLGGAHRDVPPADQRVSRTWCHRPSWCRRCIPGPTPGCCPRPWPRRWRSRSTASTTCCTCRRRRRRTACLTLTVTFRVGTDVDLAQVQVQNRVSQALPRLPEEVRQQGVTAVKSSPNITMVVHLVSPDNRYDMTYLRNYARLQVKDVLGRIPGVGQVQLFGAGDYAMRVWLDPAERWPPAAWLPATWWPPSASRTCRWLPVWWAAAPDARRRVDYTPHGQRPGPAGGRAGVRRHHHQDRGRRAGHPSQGRCPHRTRRRVNTACARC